MKTYYIICSMLGLAVLLTGCLFSNGDGQRPERENSAIETTTEIVFSNKKTEPTEAAEPTEITEPTEAAESTEITEPTEATEPAETTGPAETAEPLETMGSTETTEPSKTTEPTEELATEGNVAEEAGGI